ncbi:pilus assembly PilX family protein [Lysobacter claricitrinus]|uniref:pilus assembly PilX family protein n=1 Tax=Lysobacter claricitrinus TaxID=3367728 RepID=UPI0037DB0E4E
MKRSGPSNPRRQEGIALVVVLLLLLIVTLIGLAAMRGTLLQEQMAGNTVARGSAFQLAEAVLREGESVAAGAPTITGTGCSNGLCANPGAASDGAWQTPANYRTSSLDTSEMDAGFVIEDMGIGSDVSSSCTTAIDPSSGGCATNIKRYRITSRVHMNNGTEVVLQTNYQVE